MTDIRAQHPERPDASRSSRNGPSVEHLKSTSPLPHMGEYRARVKGWLRGRRFISLVPGVMGRLRTGLQAFEDHDLGLATPGAA